MNTARKGAWRTSSYSSASATSNCVEVVVAPARVGVRDSKNVPGPALSFPMRAWREFLGQEAAQ